MQNAKSQYLNKRFTNNHGQSGFVLKYVSCTEVYFKFDLTGFVGCFTAQNIRNGKFKDKLNSSVFGAGVVGDGKYKATENGKITKAYSVWRSMLQRCYDEKVHRQFPNYIGCSVAVEWHDFQVFAEWFEVNYPKDGKDYQLDKDHLVKGNKIYSADTCCFLTLQQNVETSQSKHYTLISPNGEKVDIYNLRKFCRNNALTVSSMCMVANGIRKSHKGWSRAS
jgi:hypothetical protein